MFKNILVTGGAGFIGSSFIRYGLKAISSCQKLVNLDLLTYAANLLYLKEIEKDSRYVFVKGDICDQKLVASLCKEHAIDAIVHFAAESHVDRSIENPMLFFETNVRGTLVLLEVVRSLPHIHFHHISTDEVYGSIEKGLFSESSPYLPNSPYAASKAASDHLVRSYAHTYDLSTTLSHCTNNYGPCQFPEKLIPRMIANCLSGAPLPLYGTGNHVRDWLYVDDHAEAIWMILEKGKRGEIYDISGECEKKNQDLLHLLIEEVAAQTKQDVAVYRSQIIFVKDRPGHDLRYAIDCSKIKREIGWEPSHTFEEGLKKTVSWYLENQEVLC